MRTAVLLRSDDCLRCRLRHHDEASCLTASSIRSQRNPNQDRRRKRSPMAGDDRSPSVVKLPGANLVMGQVKILKRGEKLQPENAAKKKSEEEGFDFVLGSTDRLGPDPDMVQKQVRVPELTEGMYAGPSSVASPPPRTVPVPGFLGKKKFSAAAADGGLRRLLV